MKELSSWLDAKSGIEGTLGVSAQNVFLVVRPFD